MLVEEGVIQSFDLPETAFGMTAQSMLIPPFPIATALFLGWGEGNTAALMEKIWPVGCEVTGVDIHDPDPQCVPHVFFKREAWQFAEWSEKIYDFICVDVYKGRRIPDFVWSEKFVNDLGRITGKMLALNVTFHSFNEAKNYGKHFVIDAIKRVTRSDETEDRVIFMVPKRGLNGKEKET